MVPLSTWKTILILGISFVGVALAAPNLLSHEDAGRLPGWLPSRQVNLGPDLQGGSQLLLEINAQSVIGRELSSFVDTVRDTLRKERIFYSALGREGNSVVLQLRNPADLPRLREIIAALPPGGEGGGAASDFVLQAADQGAVTLALSDDAMRAREARVIDRSLKILRQRIDEAGFNEPTIEREVEDRILVQLPGVEDPVRVTTLIGSRARLTLRLIDDQATPEDARRGAAPGTNILPVESGSGGGPSELVVYRDGVIYAPGVAEAKPVSQDGRPAVSFRLDAPSAKRLEAMTSSHIGHRIAFVLDNKVIGILAVQNPIADGKGIFSGDFTAQQAQDFALLLRTGGLPGRLDVVEERSVGPSLGADSIQDGKYAVALGFVLVACFMMGVYGLFGLFANLALAVNLSLILGLISAFGTTLTLPGIAGIVLTMGVAVDADILIFERLREEVRSGRAVADAVEAGFRRAGSTIMDSSLTMLIAGLLLFIVGSGPVKGFAITLSIGIVTSAFSAMMLARLMVLYWLRRWQPKALPI